jgi:hypothetical protein
MMGQTMKALTFLVRGAALVLVLSAAGCKQHGDNAMRETKFPGMVTAGGGTSGQVMAAHGGPKTDATYAGGTPGIAGGSGGNTSGAATGGTVRETGQGPTAGVSAPAGGTPQQGTTNAPSGDSGNNPVKAPAEPAPQPAAAHRDAGASSAAPGTLRP